MLSNVLNLALLVAFPLSALAANHGHFLNRRHADLAKQVELGNSTNSPVRRASGARWSYYDVETGNAWVTIASPLFPVFIILLPVVLAAGSTGIVTLCGFFPCIL